MTRMEPRPASDSRTEMVLWMTASHTNSVGNVHGGTVLKLCDDAAGAAAIRHCRRRVVTAAVDRVTFLLPIHVGQLLTLRATVNAVWRTSMEIGVRVEAEDPRSGELRHTNSAYITMVALDDDGHPTPVPPLLVEDAEGRRREREAQLRRRTALAEREQILAAREARGEPGP
jgi:acyl-CoA hydrolase